jgi:hypothetical protein
MAVRDFPGTVAAVSLESWQTLGWSFCFGTGNRLTEKKVFVWAEFGGVAEAVSLKWSQARN